MLNRPAQPESGCSTGDTADTRWKLWIYTNYDCNLCCAYCLARSSPRSERRAMGLETVQRLVDEACALNIERVFFTGGEPFLLPEIYEMLAYSAARLPTTVLTNAMLLRGERLEKLFVVAHPNLTVQVSLDGASAEQHDPYRAGERGAGSWQKTVAGIRALLARGFHVRLATTVTPANAVYLDAICAFHQQLGIPEEDHIVRPLAKRGFSQEGELAGKETLQPEITVDIHGVYWHPIATDEDMLVSRHIFPLADSLRCLQNQLSEIQAQSEGPLRTIT